MTILPHKRHPFIVKYRHDHRTTTMNDNLGFVFDIAFANGIDAHVKNAAVIYVPRRCCFRHSVRF
ncbi:MAG: hypothetical protein WBD16_15545 [Pyrinomonadaceae bacterium]